MNVTSRSGDSVDGTEQTRSAQETVLKLLDEFLGPGPRDLILQASAEVAAAGNEVELAALWLEANNRASGAYWNFVYEVDMAASDPHTIAGLRAEGSFFRNCLERELMEVSDRLVERMGNLRRK
jgi:hypothetical protein